MVGNLPANAGNMGSGPGLGRSRMPRSGWAREPQLLGLRAWSLCSAAGEAAVVSGLCTAMGSGPRLLWLGRALAQRRRPNTAINQSINQSINKPAYISNIWTKNLQIVVLNEKASNTINTSLEDQILFLKVKLTFMFTPHPQ